MKRRRRRGLSYLPPAPTRTPFIIYILLAGLFFGGIFFFKGQVVKTISGKIMDAYTGKPVVGATILLENDSRLAKTGSIAYSATTSSDVDGAFTFDKATDNLVLTVTANSYRPEKVQTNPTNGQEIRLRPKNLYGTVNDNQNRPLVQAAVTLADKTVFTDSTGNYVLEDVPENGQLQVKAAGYRSTNVTFNKTQNQNIILEPQINKGVYLRAASVADPSIFPNVLNLISSSELNTVVIDLKDSNGMTFYDSKVALARPVAANKGKITDLPAVVKTLKDKNIYSVARISVFQDASLTDVKPELAVKSKSTGRLWEDSAKFNWANPYLKEVWDYNIGLAKELAGYGFDEIQFAFVQFPSGGNLADIDYGRPSNLETRVTAISDFLKQANTELNKLGVFVSVEIMGQSVLEGGDLGIGQDISQIADLVDYVSPVLFPSYFGVNSFGHDKPATQPYDVINRGLTFARAKLKNKRAQLRPWLQDFSAEGITYGGTEVRAEIQATEDYSKTAKENVGWLLWNTEAKYTASALKKK